MIFSWLKKRRRRRLLAQPFPASWLQYLQQNVLHYRFLTAAEQAKLRDAVRIFIAEKYWEGCRGLTITDEMRVTIAGLACLLVLGLEENYFDRVRTILLYPSGFHAPQPEEPHPGILVEDSVPKLGEAWYRGPVILSWEDVLADIHNPGDTNLVFHEFAHQLDMLDGAVDGTPPLSDAGQYRRWQKVMTAEYERLIQASERGWATLLDSYGATSEAEFFAVATECFFEQPLALQRRHPRLYKVLREYYRQDPASRVPPDWPA
jgi:Mlc titration factor MtfA (ptsG expression regulator)